MTPQEIIENNILIAEFIGWKRETVVRDSDKRPYDFVCPEHIEVIGESDWDYCSDCGRDTYRKNYLFGEDLRFHRDWNWLMEIVDKIESLEGCEVILSKYLIEIYKGNLCKSFSKITTSKIEATYKACAEFVKWFNQNKGGN